MISIELVDMSDWEIEMWTDEALEDYYNERMGNVSKIEREEHRDE
jgi:hypothetical protein